MKRLLKRFQATIFEMYLAGRLTESDLNILGALSEGMEANPDAVETVLRLSLEDLRDQDIVDCILARQFKTALLILN